MSMMNINSLKEESDRLIKERNEIEQRLKKYDPQQRSGRGRRGGPSRENDSHPNKRQRSDREMGTSDSKNQPKLLSSIAIVRSVDSESVPDERWKMEGEHEKPQQEAYSKPVTVQRNKRMFSALMGHLNSAQKTLQRDSSLIEKQDQRKSLASEKNSQESKRVAELHKIVTREQKDKELHLRDIVVAKQAKLEICIATASWKDQQKKLERYLLTLVEPRLTWLPGKPNSLTDDLLQQRSTEITEAISKRELQDEERIARIDADVATKEEQRRLERLKLGGDNVSDKLERQSESGDTPTEDAVGETTGNQSHGLVEDDDDENDGDDILAALDGRQNQNP